MRRQPANHHTKRKRFGRARRPPAATVEVVFATASVVTVVYRDGHGDCGRVRGASVRCLAETCAGGDPVERGIAYGGGAVRTVAGTGARSFVDAECGDVRGGVRIVVGARSNGDSDLSGLLARSRSRALRSSAAWICDSAADCGRGAFAVRWMGAGGGGIEWIGGDANCASARAGAA